VLQAVLEPDYSLGSSVDPSDLERAAQILSSRCRELGTHATFRTNDQGQIIASVMSLHPTQFFEIGGTAIGLVELVDLGEAPIELGTTIVTDFSPGYEPDSGGTKWHAVVTNKEIESASAMRDPSGEYAVELTLTPDGKDILALYTAQNIDSYMGVVVDKVVLSAPRVISPITEGKAVVEGLAEDEATRLMVLINGEGPLPIPLRLRSFEITSQ
jgi:preprotein translocase subunit SecD